VFGCVCVSIYTHTHPANYGLAAVPRPHAGSTNHYSNPCTLSCALQRIVSQPFNPFLSVWETYCSSRWNCFLAPLFSCNHNISFGEGFSLTLGEKRRLSALDSSGPKLFRPKREKKAGGWRTLHYVDLHDFHSSPNIIRVVESWTMKGAGHAACTGGKEERM